MAAKGTNLIQVTDDTFDDKVLQAPVPFLLDLTGERCAPCKAIAPIIEELAHEYSGRVQFGTVDIYANPMIPTKYQVRSIPTLLMFSGGNVVGQLTGAHPKDRIIDLIDRAL